MRGWWLWLGLLGCDYRVSLHDCFVSCGAETACPSEMSCVAGFCRTPGATQSCEAVLGDAHLADSHEPGDAAASDAARDASLDAPLGTPDYYGCYTVNDNSSTCNALCATEGHTCSTACSGPVWYAYSLVGPCSASQPTSYSGTSCSENAVIGTGHTIYVQCCCR